VRASGSVACFLASSLSIYFPLFVLLRDSLFSQLSDTPSPSTPVPSRAFHVFPPPSPPLREGIPSAPSSLFVVIFPIPSRPSLKSPSLSQQTSPFSVDTQALPKRGLIENFFYPEALSGSLYSPPMIKAFPSGRQCYRRDFSLDPRLNPFLLRLSVRRPYLNFGFFLSPVVCPCGLAVVPFPKNNVCIVRSLPQPRPPVDLWTQTPPQRS